jgi:phosphoribosyl-AMP cyclohydrolase / phosphoribosyl-ATP pyrophosphohydrolase
MAAADRTIRTPTDLDDLQFNAASLIPVVAQEAGSGEVLMVAWASREALELTLESGFMHYWSRSRRTLWKKGETSGNLQEVVSLHGDCDGDTVLARVRMTGPACHTGDPTCFGSLPTAKAEPASAPATGEVLEELWKVLESRNRERPEGSYTTRLLTDENLRLKKLGEETVELVTALIRGEERASEEAADLIYHLMVALLGAGRSWAEVADELDKRRG